MRVWMTRQGILDFLIEIIAIRSGLLIDRERLTSIIENGYDEISSSALILGGASKWWVGPNDEFVGIRPEQLEAEFIHILFSIGAINDKRSGHELVRDYVLENAKKIKGESQDKMALYKKSLEIIQNIQIEKDIPYLKDLIEQVNNRSILSRNYPSEKKWDGVLPLEDLFESEEIQSNIPTDNYFDQRYIDYLSRQREVVLVCWTVWQLC